MQPNPNASLLLKNYNDLPTTVLFEEIIQFFVIKLNNFEFILGHLRSEVDFGKRNTERHYSILLVEVFY